MQNYSILSLYWNADSQEFIKCFATEVEIPEATNNLGSCFTLQDF